MLKFANQSPLIDPANVLEDLMFVIGGNTKFP